VQAAAEELSETVKLTRREGFSAYVAAVGIPTQKYRITVEVGETFPLHAGAAGKTLLALESAALFEEVLSGELETFTSRTVTDSEEIRAQAAEIRRRGFAEDFGEYDPHIHAVAFPLDTHTPEGPYALSIPYLAPIDEERRGVLIERGRATAAAIIAVWEESSRRP
jgi:DNA-binding IclR family transcriptional regulator